MLLVRKKLDVLRFLRVLWDHAKGHFIWKYPVRKEKNSTKKYILLIHGWVSVFGRASSTGWYMYCPVMQLQWIFKVVANSRSATKVGCHAMIQSLCSLPSKNSLILSNLNLKQQLFYKNSLVLDQDGCYICCLSTMVSAALISKHFYQDAWHR